MIFSPTVQHALRALLYLAKHADGGPVRSSRIAAREGIPRQFLSKILHNLRTRGMVVSTRGPGGGFALAGSAAALTVGDIVRAIDGGKDLAHLCLLGRRRCREEDPCALHRQWKRIRSQFTETIGTLHLAEAVRTAGRSTERRKRR